MHAGVGVLGLNSTKQVLPPFISCSALNKYADSLISNLFSQQTEIAARHGNSEAKFNWLRFFGGLVPDAVVGTLLHNPQYNMVVQQFWPTILTGFAQGKCIFHILIFIMLV